MQRMAYLLVMMLGGCGLYFGGGGGGGGTCNEPVKEEPAGTFRDPYTGKCEYDFYTCDPCHPCIEGGADTELWANCSSMCAGKDVTTCEATPTCQAEYLDTVYWGCFPVEPLSSAPPMPAGCAGLNADQCTQLDSCIAVYTGGNNPDDSLTTSFLRCDSEAPPPPPPAACDTLTTEMDCVSRADCDAVYTGSDCTCDRNGCVCKTEVFASCQTR